MSQKQWQSDQRSTQGRHGSTPSGHASSDVAEVRLYVREAVEGERSVKRGLDNAARALGISHSRAWSFYYGKARQVLAHEMDEVRRRFAALKKSRIGRLKAEIRRLEGLDVELSARLEGQAAPGVGTPSSGGVATAALVDRGATRP